MTTSPEQIASHPWVTYRRLLGYARPHWRRLLAGFVFGLLFAGANGAFVWIIKGGGGVTAVFSSDATMGGWALALLLAAFPLVGLLRGVAEYFANYYIQWVGNRVVMDLRNEMFRHVHELPVAFFSGSRTGELISRITNDSVMIERAVSTIVGDLAKQPVTLVLMLVGMFVLDWRLASLSMLVFPVCVVPISMFGQRVRRYSRQAQERTADLVSILQESVSGIRVVKAFGMEAYEVTRFARQTGAFFSRIMRVARAKAAIQPIIVFIASAGIAGVLMYVYMVKMTVGEFFAFTAALFLMYDPVKKLSKIHLIIQQSSASADRIFELLDSENPIRDCANAAELPAELERVVFEHVGFSYDDDPVLRDICLDVRAGERMALVGGSGAGKTTLVNLLPRFFDVTSGRVLINGRDVREWSLVSLRSRMGLVTQETFLFNDTVANNIGYGSGDVTREQIEDAARRAHAHDFISVMPQGYETVIGERGVRLSGGQRQRLAIARAILRNPPLLILDEATSALDTESERMVQAALDALMQGRTVFAIAHRLSTIVNSDRIVVLDAGRIVEIGSHADLMRKQGAYKRLYDMQFDTQVAPG